MSVYSIIFSPTGGTKKAADLFVNSFCPESICIDLCSQSTDFSLFSFHAEDICIVSVPSYGGRVPAAAIERLHKMHGNKAAAILIVVYGNRAYEDTFAELQDTLTDAGFSCTAGVAAIAEHSIMRQFAAGRPDDEDAKELAGFAEAIRSKIESGTAATQLKLPGNRPYKEYGGVPLKPQAGKSCRQCGLCAKECPVGAIPADNLSGTDVKKCISCMRCIAICPHQARTVSKALLAASSMKLKKACSGYKKNEIFI